MSLSPSITTLGRDPDRQHRINADSYQQHALTTVNGWQYAAYYTSKPEDETVLFVTLSRRQLGVDSTWETFTFKDYEQTVDDGHNTISIGIAKGDGTIHIAFDHHCDPLRFRNSNGDIATDPANVTWTVDLFGPVQNTLPGLGHISLLDEVTYPRFVNADNDLLLGHRIGQAGLGSDVLYHYSSTTHSYKYQSTPLTGVANSPYINGLDYRNGLVQLSWCYRAYTALQAQTAETGAHKAQAGPNGPENNHGLYFMHSRDLGETWEAGDGRSLTKSSQETVLPDAAGICVFDIPKDSGILNQEGQSPAWDGGFWVLNRERDEVEGERMQRWRLYRRDASEGKWSAHTVPTPPVPTTTGARGKVVSSRKDEVFVVLPGNESGDTSLTVLKAEKEDAGDAIQFRTLWTGQGYDGEPLIDVMRLETQDVLSVFTRTAGKGGEREVVVLDFVVD